MSSGYEASARYRVEAGVRYVCPDDETLAGEMVPSGAVRVPTTPEVEATRPWVKLHGIHDERLRCPSCGRVFSWYDLAERETEAPTVDRSAMTAEQIADEINAGDSPMSFTESDTDEKPTTVLTLELDQEREARRDALNAAIVTATASEDPFDAGEVIGLAKIYEAYLRGALDG